MDGLVQWPEQGRLERAAGQVMGGLQGVPGVGEPTSSQEGEIPQLDVDVDREQAWAAGVGIGSIAQTLQPLFTGQRATTLLVFRSTTATTFLSGRFT